MEGRSNDNNYEHMISSDEVNLYLIHVPRMKLRMRFNDSSSIAASGGSFNFNYQEIILIVGSLYDNYPLKFYHPTCSVQIPVDEPPSSHIISSALDEIHVREEFQHDLTGKILEFSGDSVSSIDIDIMVVTGKYEMGRNKVIDWDRIEEHYVKMTRSFFTDRDDQDYVYTHLFPSRPLFVNVPLCTNYCRCLRAIRYDANDVSEVKTCAICLDELVKSNQQIVVSIDVLRMSCNHLFHDRCIISWLRTKNTSTCPLCRTAIKLYTNSKHI